MKSKILKAERKEESKTKKKIYERTKLKEENEGLHEYFVLRS